MKVTLRLLTVFACSLSTSYATAETPGQLSPAKTSTVGQHALEQSRAAKINADAANKRGDSLAAQRWNDVVERWKRVAVLLERAAEVARQATQIEEHTSELKTQARRARNLVEQTEIRRARALGELRRLGVEPVPSQPQTTAPAAQP